jgi:hypothetical protein
MTMSEQYTAINLPARLWAIRDGALADTTLEASLAGIGVPVAVTCIALIESTADLPGWEFARIFARRVEVMTALSRALYARRGPFVTLDFVVEVNKGTGRARLLSLRAVAGTDRLGNPHLTVTTPQESGPGGTPSPFSRDRALADGVLIDATAAAEEAGLAVALSRGAWAACVAVPAGVVGQTEGGRLLDVFDALHLALANCPDAVPGRRFRLCVDTSPNEFRDVALVAVSGRGDDGTPHVTVMLPDEA